jgi:hypothetical protein
VPLLEAHMKTSWKQLGLDKEVMEKIHRLYMSMERSKKVICLWAIFRVDQGVLVEDRVRTRRLYALLAMRSIRQLCYSSSGDGS